MGKQKKRVELTKEEQEKIEKKAKKINDAKDKIATWGISPQGIGGAAIGAGLAKGIKAMPKATAVALVTQGVWNALGKEELMKETARYQKQQAHDEKERKKEHAAFGEELLREHREEKKKAAAKRKQTFADRDAENKRKEARDAKDKSARAKRIKDGTASISDRTTAHEDDIRQRERERAKRGEEAAMQAARKNGSGGRITGLVPAPARTTSDCDSRMSKDKRDAMRGHPRIVIPDM